MKCKYITTNIAKEIKDLKRIRFLKIFKPLKNGMISRNYHRRYKCRVTVKTQLEICPENFVIGIFFF